MTLQDKWEAAKISYEKKEAIKQEDDLRDDLALGATFSAFNYLGKGFKVLDLGCGNGRLNGKPVEYYGYSYINPIHDIYGCDVIDYPDYPGVSFTLAKAESLPFSNGAFDAVCIQSALDHMLEPVVVFKECYRVLNPDGKLFICQGILHEYPGLAVSHHKHHIYDYSISAVVQLYQISGFLIKRIKIASQYMWMFEGVKTWLNT